MLLLAVLGIRASAYNAMASDNFLLSSMVLGTKQPVVGSDCILSEGRPLPLHCLPVEVGLRANPVEYTCIDASQQFLAVGSAQGYVWVVDLQSSRLLREFGVSSDLQNVTQV